MVLIILQNNKKLLNDFAVRTLNYFVFHSDLLFLYLFINVSAGYMDLCSDDFVSDQVFIKVVARHAPLVLRAALIHGV
jgi:hypothetical protein